MAGRKWVVEKRWLEFFSDPSQWWDNRSEKVTRNMILVITTFPILIQRHMCLISGGFVHCCSWIVSHGSRVS